VSFSTEPLLKFQGLASGLHTEEIIDAMMSVERRPLTRMSDEQKVLEAQESALRKIKGSVQQLGLSAGELASPLLFEKTQTVTSSEPTRIGAALTGSAPPGGYQMTVSQLASAAQRAFTFKSPGEERTITIEGQEIKVKANETLAELASAINSDSKLSVIAATVGSEQLVLSERETGKQTGPYLVVTSTGEVLTEKAGSARVGTNALYTINGTEGESRTNTLTEAIAGVTLTLSAATASAVTIDVTQPALDEAKVIDAVKSFISEYNATIGQIGTELQTKPPETLEAQAAARSGTLFGDTELSELGSRMREAIYTPAAGLPATMADLMSIGVTTGAPTGASESTQSSLEGKLVLEEATLKKALAEEPEGVKKMLAAWSESFKTSVEAYSGIGGSFETRLEGDETRATYIGGQMTALSENLEVRQHTLEATYVALETTLSRLKGESSWLASQLASTAKSISPVP
jgi:flagellar hook-associated protein 2